MRGFDVRQGSPLRVVRWRAHETRTHFRHRGKEVDATYLGDSAFVGAQGLKFRVAGPGAGAVLIASAGTIQLQASNSSGSGTVTIKTNSDLVARRTG